MKMVNKIKTTSNLQKKYKIVEKNITSTKITQYYQNQNITNNITFFYSRIKIVYKKANKDNHFPF